MLVVCASLLQRKQDIGGWRPWSRLVSLSPHATDHTEHAAVPGWARRLRRFGDYGRECEVVR